MNRPPLAGAAADALAIAFALGALLAPPDPLTQLVYARPAFLVALPVVYRHGRRSEMPWWKRYLVFVGGLFAAALAWRAVAAAVGTGAAAGVRPAVLFAGVAVGAWLGFFGGLTRLRGGA